MPAVPETSVSDPPPTSISTSATAAIPNAPAPSATASVISTAAVAATTPADLLKEQIKYIAHVLKISKRVKDAGPFLQPVDPIALGIPHYPTIIPNPMDISTILRNIDANGYTNTSQIIADFNLIIDNCVTFNGEDSAISQMARSLLIWFNKQIEKLPQDVTYLGRTARQQCLCMASGQREENQDRSAPLGKQWLAQPGILSCCGSSAASKPRPRREVPTPVKETPMSPKKTASKKSLTAELKWCTHLHKELSGKRYSEFNWPFLEPVDPIKLNVPTYFSVIKYPMDLSTVRQKLESGSYDGYDDFYFDIHKIFENCYVFNLPDTEVYRCAQKLETAFEEKWIDRPPAEDEEEDEDGTWSNRNLAVQIKNIEATLAGLNAQLDTLRDMQRRRREKKRERPQSSKKRKIDSDGVPEVSYEQKHELSILINQLPPEKVPQVFEIITAGMPQFSEPGQEEIELEIDALDRVTLHELYKFVKANTVGAADVAPVRTPKKAKNGKKSSDKKKKQGRSPGGACYAS
ncbi:Bromodomain-containing protein [Polychytrium aggregatum]|uniref:Bromodomain-containing protein n=1 Tax=Polychytrium aggregatum TaxID=110093 RepID=UPI0022FED785|nr:Bromodomain-containing protein [Polychytrium aggregatum]KAI9193089.1 Bromodomain-containing protein [Polychytrium aggregatum]